MENTILKFQIVHEGFEASIDFPCAPGQPQQTVEQIKALVAEFKGAGFTQKLYTSKKGGNGGSLQTEEWAQVMVVKVITFQRDDGSIVTGLAFKVAAKEEYGEAREASTWSPDKLVDQMPEKLRAMVKPKLDAKEKGAETTVPESAGLQCGLAKKANGKFAACELRVVSGGAEAKAKSEPEEVKTEKTGTDDF